MSLLKDLKPKQKVLACKVRDVAATLDADDSKILLDAVTDTNWGCTVLSNALAERGIKLSDKVIKRHRTNTCSCRPA